MGDVLSESGSSAYRDALAYLFARTTGKSRFGLERTREFLRVLGDPHRAIPILHVAGTNGKGSVCATLEALLRAKGLRVAKYTSPHLVDFCERFLIDGAPISEDEVTDFITRWTPDVERIGATFFEATTSMAFERFAYHEVDVAIVETGLGGTLDSTNVVDPLVASVTSIGIDHTELLGDTREAIAGEKAGIFKRGVPAVIGEGDPAIRALLASHAREHGASPVRIVADDAPPSDVSIDHRGTTFRLTLGGETATLRTPLAGAHQASNAAVALLMLDLAGAPLRVPLSEAAASLANVHLPGRFQRVGKYIFDVAHNPDGVAVLVQTLRAVQPPAPLVALLTVLADKDWRGIMRNLAPVVQLFVLTTAPTAPASRAWHVDEAIAFARSEGWDAVVEPDFERALASADALGASVLITGSFHTVGDAMTRLQVDPLAP